ncbi:helix-turn-helix domain-containing protein [Allocoprobacillus halotolerans]|uniref:Helix-turn-helix domain-containing protein n=1 Tax=Allocoprobacillus halotolerans TaxID=2944914 RepID=A0ABY5HZE3_9FIRM|nr:helix-turn-helix domain-containing protein [Allocoprobacillus halotolerans]UTY38394.1 helix-turn-helix domain-containing protein [Allocoprobacillus halotolerans]
MIVNNLLEDVFLKLVHSMYRRAKGRMKVKSLFVGIGTKMKDIRELHLSYQRALSAVSLARMFHQNIMCFDDMGIYQILFSIQDKKILSDMYHRLLDCLIQYDKKHHGELEKTFYYYLKYDGSPQKIAKVTYTHRNTVNYRIDKIKKLLNNDLATFEDKFPYMMAFYIAKMME